MNQGDNPTLKRQEKEKMLDELESLSRLLDEDLEDDLEDGDATPFPEDIPVLKSFVDDVPVLNERFESEPTPVPVTPPPAQKTDSLDTSAASFRTVPNTRAPSRLDDSFLDKDPLEISAAVRENRKWPDVTASKPATPILDNIPTLEPAAAVKPAPAPAAPRPAAPIPPSVSASFMPGAGSTAKPAPAPAAPAPAEPQPMTAAKATQPLTRFQSSSKSENPFLPKATLDKIRENHANDASSELRKLIENNPLQKLSFDMSPNSREYQQLRQKASQMVNDVIRANMPRLEAELRLKLEQEVDRMFKELKKK